MADAARVAIMTGASRGIGRATATALAQAGLRLVLSYRERGQPANNLVESVRRTGAHPWPLSPP